MNDSITLSADNITVGYDSSSDNVTYYDGTETCPFEWDYWSQPIYREYYPIYCNHPVYRDNYKKAFSIAKMLLKKNLVVSKRLKDFIGLVEEIAKEL